MNQSAHVIRKTGYADTAFTHKVHDFLNESHDDDSEDDAPETKDQYFEFSDAYGIMRLVRLIIFVQIVGLVLDHPSMRISHLFDIFCRGVLYYSMHFYSRPFIDAIYVLQLFWATIYKLIASIQWPSGVLVTSPRRLNVNPYLHGGQLSTEPHSLSWDMDMLSESNWHTVKHFSHYFLGLLFIMLAVLFTLRLWEIHDYSDREEVKKWLNRYIADGWWMRGGLNIATSTASICFAMALLILLMNTIANSMGADSISSGLLLSTAFAIGLSVTLVIWGMALAWIKTTEKTFLKYVSQNVAYTSVIILKRAVKAKFDIGIVLMVSLFVPVLYTLLQAQLSEYSSFADALLTADRLFCSQCSSIGTTPSPQLSGKVQTSTFRVITLPSLRSSTAISVRIPAP